MRGPVRFRKRPVMITAMQWDGTAAGASAVVDWIAAEGGVASYQCASGVCYGQHADVSHRIDIETLEGTMAASGGDWVIRGVHGEFYPCRDAIFTSTYDPVEG